MRRSLLTVASLLGSAGMSAAAATGPISIAKTHDEDLAAAIRSRLPVNYLEGVKATVKLVSLKGVPYLHDPRLATFVVDYEPGGSAVLRRSRTPASGYVLVYVLSGVIRAQAWGAGLGTYRKARAGSFLLSPTISLPRTRASTSRRECSSCWRPITMVLGSSKVTCRRPDLGHRRRDQSVIRRD